MSWRDRAYYHGQRSSYDDGGSSFGLPKPTRYVKYLLIINVAVFIIDNVIFRESGLGDRFALTKIASWSVFLEAGRLITYQFLHGDLWHIAMNMLGLYFFGTPLESFWGGKKFLFFYFFCGVAGGILFLLLAAHASGFPVLIGASGAVLGLLAACAVLFPHMTIILFVFPVPIRFAAILLVGLYGLNTLVTQNLSDACHLGGMVAGFLFIKARPLWQNIAYQRDKLRRQALLKQEMADQQTVDQILEKVHQQGLQSLTWREKRTLKAITRRQKQRDDMRKKNW